VRGSGFIARPKGDRGPREMARWGVSRFGRGLYWDADVGWESGRSMACIWRDASLEYDRGGWERDMRD
jgi:hypothetical protein